MAMDWEGDGDLDLLLGAKEGQLYLQRNEGTSAEPKFTGVNEMIQAGGANLSVEGGLTAAKIVDWDGDGRDDLVCGSFEGGAYLYRDTAKEGAPSFAAPVSLIRADTSENDGTKGPGSDWYIDVVDYDRDGTLDLVVGGHYRQKAAAKVLTADETAELEKLKAESKTLEEKMMKIITDGQKALEGLKGDALKEATEALYNSPELEAVYEQMDPLRQRINELAPMPKRVSGVWLYRGQAAI